MTFAALGTSFSLTPWMLPVAGLCLVLTFAAGVIGWYLRPRRDEWAAITGRVSGRYAARQSATKWYWLWWLAGLSLGALGIWALCAGLG